MFDYEDKTESQYFAPGAEATLIHIRVPAGKTFIMTHFANDVDDARAWDATAGARWDVVIDGAPARSYTAIRDQFGTANQMREIPYGFIKASRDLMIIAYNDSPANTYRILASLKGVYEDNV